MNEEELKRKVEALRNEILSREKRIKKLYQEVNIHRREVNVVKLKRDKLNTKFKEKLEEIKICKERRNELNEKVTKLKGGHKSFIIKVKKQGDEIKKLKKERDKLNKRASGKEENLENRYQKAIDELLNDDISLTREIGLFDAVFKVKERLDIAKKANKTHENILKRYNEITVVKTKVDGVSKEIEKYKKEADNCHKKVIKLSKELTEIRKEADTHHERFQEKYEHVRPIMNQISAIKKEILDIQTEISPHVSELEKIRALREEQKKAETAKEIKEKLLKSKRINLDDFRILLERGELP